MIETLGGIATLTAWGNARPLEDVLAFLANETDATTVELAIGALPCSDPVTVLGFYAGRFDYVGHHAMPVLRNAMLRPTLQNVDAIVDVVKDLNLRSYSAHPPANASESEFWEWAVAYHSALRRVSCHFSVETMFPSMSANEPRFYLSTPTECFRFIDRARSDWIWNQPLLVDISHLHIGFTSGVWSRYCIDQVLAEGTHYEVHVSSNDGKRDQHRPLVPGSFEDDLAQRFIGTFPFVVDEGRRRGTVTTN